jgi:hypothetical protein
MRLGLGQRRGAGDPLGDDRSTQPLVREFAGSCTGIAEPAQGGAVGSDPDRSEQSVYRLDRPFETQDAARACLDRLPKDINPATAIGAGFRKV